LTRYSLAVIRLGFLYITQHFNRKDIKVMSDIVNYQLELETAVRAVKQAAAVCRAVQAQISTGVLEKNDRSPVTVADFASQALVCKILKEEFPDDPVIGEEDSKELRNPENRELLSSLSAEVKNILPDATDEQILGWIDRGGHNTYEQRFWTLDPIDGTKGFLRKDQYAISLALIVDGTVVAGAVCCPNLPVNPGDQAEDRPRGLVQFAQKGGGTYQSLLDSNDDPVAVKVSSRTDQSQIRLCESVEKAHSSHSDSARIAAHLGITADPVRIDSQAKYATVARGAAEAYLRLPRDGKYREKIWDHAGGVIVVEEAGGRVTDIRGESLDFSNGRRLENNLGVIVTNGTFHDDIIEAVKKLKIGQF
jgi:3'(2'), 5'-bisphosphate nucleotidase